LLHAPLPLQSWGHTLISQATPIHPWSQTGVPNSSITPFYIVFWLHSSPVKPILHTHFPNKHFPL